MGSVTGLGLIENAGPNHLRGFLKSHATSTTGIDIAVAFVTQRGLDELLPSLRKASSNRPVRIVTGLYHGFTEPQALKSLLAEQKDTQGRLSVRLSNNTRFHWKLYVLHRQKTATAVIGSSNLTAEGLGQSGELNAVMTLKRSSSAFKLLNKHFHEEWEQAVPLSKERVDRYAKVRPQKVPQPSIPLKDILGTVRKHERQPGPGENQHKPQFWRSYIDGYVSDATEQVIADRTNWDDKGYFWYSSGEPRHRDGDEIIMFDFNDGWVRLARVVDTTRTPNRTPDGRQFTAYTVVASSHRRRLDKPLRARLVSEGLLRRQSDAKRPKKLTPKTFAALSGHLGLR